MGKGIKAFIDNKEILVGNKILFKDHNISYGKNVEKLIQDHENDGKTVILVAEDRKIAGLIAIADTLKQESQRVIDQLKSMNLKIYMITGDNARTANAIAKQIGIEQVLAEVLPKDKVREVKKLEDQGEIVAFVGDGINDAPALAQANLGIALGSGTDIAIESGDIILMHDNLMDVVSSIQLSKKVMTRIKQNLFWAFAYNSALIPLSAGLFYKWLGIIFKPELAGLAMALSSVTIVTLSLMLKRYNPPAQKSVCS